MPDTDDNVEVLTPDTDEQNFARVREVLVDEPPAVTRNQLLVTVFYSGLNNGTPEQGIRTLTLLGPSINNPDDLKDLMDVAATTLFSELKYEKLQVALVNALRFPF